MKVTPVVEPVAGISGAVRVTIEIEEGEQLDFKGFEFDGNESVEAADLRASFDQYPWWDPRGWFTDVPATEQDLAEARASIRASFDVKKV